MKKIILSVAVATMALSTAAAALDNLKVDGQAVVYYETHSDNGVADKGQFDKESSRASAGIQLNLQSDLGNNFTFGSQLTYMGTLGLEESLVNAPKSAAGSLTSTTDQLALTKIFIAKKVGNTTVKMGRQELPKSLSPLAFTEGWNVYKNTFDAVLAVNTDLPKTTLVGAYVTGGTSFDLGTTADLPSVAGATYMLTAQTKLIPITTLTGTYYHAQNVTGATSLTTSTGGTGGVAADAWFLQAGIAPKGAPLGLKLDLQAGNIDLDTVGSNDTQAFGAKLSGKTGAVSFKAIYTTVSTGDVQMRNLGTNIKTPLFSQMMYNQKAIDLDNDTVVVGAAYNMGSMGTIAANYGMTDMGQGNAINTGITSQDYTELDLVYKVKSGGVQYFAIAAIRDFDNNVAINTTDGSFTAGETKDTIIRFWARYNF